jgi:hypothetical protein
MLSYTVEDHIFRKYIVGRIEVKEQTLLIYLKDLALSFGDCYYRWPTSSNLFLPHHRLFNRKDVVSYLLYNTCIVLPSNLYAHFFNKISSINSCRLTLVKYLMDCLLNYDITGL